MEPPRKPTDSVLRRIEGFAQTQHDSGYQQGYLEAYRDTRTMIARRSVAWLAAGLLLGGVIVFFIAQQGLIGQAPHAPAPDPREIGIGRGDRFRAAAEFANEFTVSISAESLTRTFFGDAVRRKQGGSGFIFDDQGHIVTNQHVVEGARTFSVIWNERVYDARLVGHHDKVDVAVLKFDAADAKGAKMLEPDQKVFQAEEVLAVGSPYGFLRHTVTSGIISYVGRDFGTQDVNIPYLQTDAAINRGNSGGPLVSLDGRVVGMNTLIISSTGESSGVGFAIPIDIVRNIARAIIDAAEKNGDPSPGKIDNGIPLSRAFLGITIEPATTNNRNVIKVITVQTLSPADRAGIKPGDLITAVDGRDVYSPDDLMAEVIQRRAPGDIITVKVLRGQQTLEMSVQLGQKTEENQ